MPSVLRLSGRAFGRSAAARLASANAVRYPERSTRTTIGLVIGVTLVTMFAVAEQSFDHMISSEFVGNPADLRAMQNVLGAVFGIFSGLVGFSGVIAGVGMVNNLSLNVLQRTRELGLLRALGFTSTQIRKTIMIESAQTVLAATVTGLILGVFYGWAGAQSLVGSVVGDGRLLPPSIPWAIVVVVFAAAAVLSVAAAAAPTRRATRVSPIVALAVD
jgi:putative ABC transport system permease protein